MSTPITDAVAKRAFPNETTSDYSGYVTMMLHALRLETDRAALMEALEGFIEEQCEARPSEYSFALGVARRTLTAAKANFPHP